jgi:guanylate kinase
MEIDTSKIKGHVVVVMAPMGSGKGTLIKSALEKYDHLSLTISCTSRHIRPGEVDGKHYHFVTKEEFQNKIENEDFLEWAEFAGNYYGTLKSEIVPKLLNCEVVVLEIEVQGVEQLLNLIPRDHMTITYIEAGGWERLKARAKARAPITDEELEARHQRYLIEKEAKPLADVIIDNTKDIETARTEFHQVIADADKKCKL